MKKAALALFIGFYVVKISYSTGFGRIF